MTSAVCGDGMWPYIPCVDFPKCEHLEKDLKGATKNG